MRGNLITPSLIATLIWALGLTITSISAEIIVAPVDGVIGPASARFMVQVIDRAEQSGAECVVFELDTPGGLDESMRLVIKRILSAKVPVVIYVSPSGARAASAGAFITMAAHVAAMAPGTTIGAAHPVNIMALKPPDTNLTAKIENDAAAYIRAIAEKRHRNVEWAERTVKESVALSETEALASNVVDLVAASLDALLENIHGRNVSVGDDVRTLNTRGARIARVAMNWRDRFLATLANPNVAYVLFMLGLLGIYFEFATPGTIGPGAVGAICLILAFFAFQTLSVNYAGVLLIGLAIVLFVLDIKAATYGVLTAGGLVAMFIGSVMLFDTPVSTLRVSMHVVIPVVLATGLFFVLGAWLSLRALRRKPTTGDAGLVGLEGDVRTAVTPQGGRVFVAGTHWSAFSKEVIPQGSPVRVIGVHGLVLEVEPVVRN